MHWSPTLFFIYGDLTERLPTGIGTGYFVERDVKDAKEIFRRKEKLVQDQIEKVQKAAQEKVN